MSLVERLERYGARCVLEAQMFSWLAYKIWQSISVNNSVNKAFVYAQAYSELSDLVCKTNKSTNYIVWLESRLEEALPKE